MTKNIQQAYADFTLGEMLIDETQYEADMNPVARRKPTFDLEEHGEAYREQAAWSAAASEARNAHDLLLKARILERYAEDDPDDVVSALMHSICGDIARLADERPEERDLHERVGLPHATAGHS